MTTRFTPALLVLLCCFSILAQPKPAPRPPAWGENHDGFAALAEFDGDVSAGGPLTLKMSLKNISGSTIKLADVFAWLLVAETKDKVFYTEKVALASEKDCPAELADGKTLDLKIDLSRRKAFAMQKGIKVVAGFPAAEGDAPKPAGTLADVLPVTALRARWTVCIPQTGKVLSVPSAMLSFEVQPRAYDTMTAEQRKAYIEQLVAEFSKSAYAGQRAHALAVKAGPDALPAIAKALEDPAAPSFARLWLATAVCDIGGETAAEEAIKLLKSDDGGVRAVIAYHGPKMHNAKLNEAILAAAENGDGGLKAWAARGMASNGYEISDRLIDAAMASPEPLARAEIATVLVKRKDEKALACIEKLLADPDTNVRGVMARALGSSELKTKRIVTALVAALDKPGDGARQTVCQTLGKFSGRTAPYDPKVSAADKEKVIADWKTWWTGAQAQYR
ncbi:MAG: HEAT repeat domain-containing protein [Tepidisphaerales bacterium]